MVVNCGQLHYWLDHDDLPDAEALVQYKNALMNHLPKFALSHTHTHTHTHTQPKIHTLVALYCYNLLTKMHKNNIKHHLVHKDYYPPHNQYQLGYIMQLNNTHKQNM